MAIVQETLEEYCSSRFLCDINKLCPYEAKQIRALYEEHMEKVRLKALHDFIKDVHLHGRCADLLRAHGLTDLEGELVNLA